ncbi:MAG: sporulation protein YtxC [Christensenellales bacterium]
MNRYFVGYDRYCSTMATSLSFRAKDALGSRFAYMQKELSAGELSFLDIMVLPVDENTLVSEEEMKEQAHERFSHALAMVVVEDMRPGELRRMLSRWPELTKTESEKLALQAEERIRKIRSKSPSWIKEAERETKELLKENGEIFLPGLIAFRMHDMRKQWQSSLEYALEKMLVEREYQEFIKLLQCFVSIQESKYSVVNVLPLGDTYLILDQDFCTLQPEFVREEEWEDMKGEDVLISVLINVAPRLIRIHDYKQANEQIVDTIDKVFEGRVELIDHGKLFRARIDKKPKDKV